MKKWSEKNENKSDNNDLDMEKVLKYKKLIEKHLKIRIEGPVDPILMGTVFIDGIDILAAALAKGE